MSDLVPTTELQTLLAKHGPGHAAYPVTAIMKWHKKHANHEVEKAVREARIDELLRVKNHTSLVPPYDSREKYIKNRIANLKD